jgi:hypothetical protein
MWLGVMCMIRWRTMLCMFQMMSMFFVFNGCGRSMMGMIVIHRGLLPVREMGRGQRILQAGCWRKVGQT